MLQWILQHRSEPIKQYGNRGNAGCHQAMDLGVSKISQIIR